MTERGAPADLERPRAREDVVFRSMAREWVLYDPRSRQLHVLNVTAALVWTLCDGDHDAPAIARVVLDTLDAPPSEDVVQGHVREALERFAAEGLLT